jgi:hypothetical protein
MFYLHIDRLRIFESVLPGTSLLRFAAADKDEYVVESIVDNRGSFKSEHRMQFRVHWQGYEASEDTWLPWKEVKDLAALDQYLENLG